MTVTTTRMLGLLVKDGIDQYELIEPCDQGGNDFAKVVLQQHIAVVPSFQLESGATLLNAPIAYRTYGTLAPSGKNVIVVCHAFTGSADVQDWWGPLLSYGGDGALDTSRFYVVCMNCLGSPYGSASPVTAIDGDIRKGCYGPTFPITTIRDDVKLFKLLLDDLGVRQVAAVVGGSMGGMHVLEFAYFGAEYVRTIVPIATTAQSSAWVIGWGEAQRQCIFSDCNYNNGYYTLNHPPSSGLGAARMNALLTYRSRDSFEKRFGRRVCDAKQAKRLVGHQCIQSSVKMKAQAHCSAHNEGHWASQQMEPDQDQGQTQYRRGFGIDRHMNGSKRDAGSMTTLPAQSYLRYQSEKFVKRFDANCYISITRKIDTHDIARDRACTTRVALVMIQQPALILGIPSDGLFTYQEQCELAACIPNARLETIESVDGHDGFLLEHDQINLVLKEFIERELADIITAQPRVLLK